MTIPVYYSPKKEIIYLRMLQFARISNMPGHLPDSKQDRNVLIEELNSLTEYINPAFRPILPLIYRNTGLSGLRDKLHPKVQKLLRDQTLRLIAADMRNRQWLLNHLEAFQRASIPIILLKGAAFAGSLYPEK
jgi:hypothetical protein